MAIFMSDIFEILVSYFVVKKSALWHKSNLENVLQQIGGIGHCRVGPTPTKVWTKLAILDSASAPQKNQQYNVQQHFSSSNLWFYEYYTTIKFSWGVPP